MGIPINNYTVLKQLADSTGGRGRAEEILTALSKFSMFAFVLYDPDEHVTFKNAFENSFSDLHYGTGERFLFWGLSSRVHEDENLAGSHSYEVIKKFVNTKSDRHVKDGYTAFAFLKHLGLSNIDLPAIIVTGDLRMKSYKWYKTCPEKIKSQMNHLGRISNEFFHKGIQKNIVEKQKDLFEKLDEHSDKINICGNEGEKNLSITLARTLANVLSFYNKDYEEQKRVIRTLTNQLEILKNQLLSIKEENLAFEDLLEQIESFSINLATLQSIDFVKKIENQFPYRDFIEKDSILLWKTGLAVQSFLKQQGDYKANFSASTICFSKLFEHEINLSFAHWIRQKQGIKLPEYFNAWQPGVTALFDRVDFNKERDKQWIPPELGRTKYIAERKFTNDLPWLDMGISMREELIDRWNFIHSCRNRAAHPGDVSFDESNQVQKSIESLYKKGVFKELYELKKRFC